MNKISLNQVKVASPCTASWDAMSGDSKARFCGQCSQHVYNLSAMTEDAAQTLIEEHEGKMCVRFYRRADGTMMTTDCPVGWRAVRRRAALIGGAAAAFVVAVFGLLTLGFIGGFARGDGGRANVVQRIHDWLFPPMVMGGIAPPPAAENGGIMVLGEFCPPDPLPQPDVVPLPNNEGLPK